MEAEGIGLTSVAPWASAQWWAYLVMVLALHVRAEKEWDGGKEGNREENA